MIKGILFDKDGTLIDFFSLWLGAAKAVVIQFLKENELSEEVKERVFYAWETLSVFTAFSIYCIIFLCPTTSLKLLISSPAVFS